MYSNKVFIVLSGNFIRLKSNTYAYTHSFGQAFDQEVFHLLIQELFLHNNAELQWKYKVLDLEKGKMLLLYFLILLKDIFLHRFLIKNT